MIVNTRAKGNKWSIPIVIIVIGVMLFFMGGKDLLVLRKDPIDVMEADPSTLKAGDHVIMKVSVVWDEIISVTETTKTYGVTTSSREASRYYAIPYLTVIEDQGVEFEIADADQFILLKMPSNYFDKMDTAMDNTNKWYDAFWEKAMSPDYSPTRLPDKPGVVLTFEGRLNKVKSEEMEYALEYVRWLEYEPDKDHPTLESYIVPYYIDPIMKPGSVVGMTIVGAAILVIGIIVLIFMIRSDKEDKELVAMMATQKPRVINTEDDQEPAPKVSFNNSLSGGPAEERPSIFDTPPAAGGDSSLGSTPAAPGTSVYGGSTAGSASPSFGSTPAYGSSAAPASASVGNTAASSSSFGSGPMIGGIPVGGNTSAGNTQPAANPAPATSSFGSGPMIGGIPVGGNASAGNTQPAANPAPATSSFGSGPMIGGIPVGAAASATAPSSDTPVTIHNSSSATPLPTGGAAGSSPSIGSFHSEAATLPMGGGSHVASFSSSPTQLPMGGGSSEIRHLGGDSLGNPLPMSGNTTMGHGALPTGAPHTVGSTAPTSTPLPMGSTSTVSSAPYMGGPLPTGSSSFGSSSAGSNTSGMTPPPMGGSVLTGRIALPTDQGSNGDNNDSN